MSLKKKNESSFIGGNYAGKVQQMRKQWRQVRTKTLSGGKYIHVCIPKGGGSSIAGEVKTKEKGKNDTNTPDGRVYRKS